MPKIHKRNCDFCGVFYRGEGKRFCSQGCAIRHRREDMAAPAPPGQAIEVDLGDDAGVVRVLRSRTIQTVAALLEHAKVDLDVWEVHASDVRKYDQAMKVDDEPVVIPLYYVSVKLRRRAADLFDLAPTVLKVSRPAKRKPRDSGGATVVCSDEHFPHHDPAAISIYYQVLDIVNPDRVELLGDTLDCNEIGTYPKDPLNRVSLSDEIAMAAQHFGNVHALTPNAAHRWFFGNHEDRLRRLVWQLADQRAAGELLTLPDVVDALRLERLTGVEDLGWETVPYPEFRNLHDRLLLCHGSKIRAKSGQTARAEYDTYKKSGMSGHTHRRGVFETRDHNGYHAWWEIGLLGKLRHDYVAFADWQQGFAVVTWAKDRQSFHPELVRIHDGAAFFRGKLLVGDAMLDEIPEAA